MVKKKYLALITLLVVSVVGILLFGMFFSSEKLRLNDQVEWLPASIFQEYTDMDADNSQYIKELRQSYGNEDIIGYINLKGTHIAYPLLQGKDNEKYLYQNPAAQNDINGSIYLDMDNAANLMDPSSLIYGHDMLDGSMFGSLDNYYSTQESFQTTGGTFIIYLEKGTYVYDIVAYGVVHETERDYILGATPDWNISTYVSKAQQESSIRNAVTPTESTKVVNLITCFGNESELRVRVLGVLKI